MRREPCRILLFLILCNLLLFFSGCDEFGAAPPLEKPVPPPIFLSFSRNPDRIKTGETSSISFSVNAPVSKKSYQWFVMMANQAGGTVDSMTGSGLNGHIYTIHFTSKNETPGAEVAVTAWYPINAGTGRRSATQCACIAVTDDPKSDLICQTCSVLIN